MADNGIDYTAKQRRVQNRLLVAAMFFGVVFLQVPEGEPAGELIAGMPILVLPIYCRMNDGEQCNFHIGRMHTGLLVFVFALAFPVYLLRKRGTGGRKAPRFSQPFDLGMRGSAAPLCYDDAMFLNGGGSEELNF